MIAMKHAKCTELYHRITYVVLLLAFRAAPLYMVSAHFLMSLVDNAMLPKCSSCIKQPF